MQPMKRPIRLCPPPASIVLITGALFLTPRAHALTSSWMMNGGGTWSNPANWNNGAPTNTGDVAVITNTITANGTITNDTPVILGTLRIGPTGFRYNFQSGNSITMDSGGSARAVLQQTGSQQNFGPANVIMNSDLEINNNGGTYFNLTATILSGNHDLFINANGASGTPYIGGANTFIGNLTICSGKLMNTGSTDPFGSITNGTRVITITNNAAFRLNGSFTMATNRLLVAGSGGAQLDMNAKALTINRNDQVTGSNTLSLLNSTGSGGTVVLGGTNDGLTGSVILGSGITLKLNAGGGFNHVPVLNMTHTGCVFDVASKTSGYTLPSNQVLAGIGVVSGLVTVANASTLHPGSYALPGPTTSSGILTLADGVSFSNGGIYAWDLAQLKDNAFAPGITAYSQLNVAGGGVSLDGGAMTINFLSGIDTPGSTNVFWNTNHTWTVISATTPPSGTLSIINGTYANWAFTTRVNGNTLELVYGPYTPPRKGTLISIQ